MNDENDENDWLKAYNDAREGLIEEAASLRSDALFRSSLSPGEQRACAIVDKIRKEEAEKVWSNSGGEGGGGNDELYPGMPFGFAKERIRETKLWEIVKRMPKGALLHAHGDAMVQVRDLVDIAIGVLQENEEAKEDGDTLPLFGDIYMQSDKPLVTLDDLRTAKIRFRYYKLRTAKKPTLANPVTMLYSPHYSPGSFTLLSDAIAQFPPSDTWATFADFLNSKASITHADAQHHQWSHKTVWDKFAECFMIVEGLIFHEPIFRRYLQKMLEGLLDDGVKWVDVRWVFARSDPNAGMLAGVDLARVFDEEVQRFKASHPDFWGARIIYCFLRSLGPEALRDSLDECVKVKQALPHVIAGFDMVGQEDAGLPLKDYIPELLAFMKRCRELGLDIPFMFHAGETLSSGTDADDNLYDAVLLGAKRIGHAFSLHKHPVLMQKCAEDKICIESCPISNEVLRLTPTILTHPLPALLANGVTCTLSNDDPAILGQGETGVSMEFYQCLMAWDTLGLAGAGALVEASVQHAAFETEEERNRRVAEWRAEFRTFCRWVVEDSWEMEKTKIKTETPVPRIKGRKRGNEEIATPEPNGAFSHLSSYRFIKSHLETRPLETVDVYIATMSPRDTQVVTKLVKTIVESGVDPHDLSHVKRLKKTEIDGELDSKGRKPMQLEIVLCSTEAHTFEEITAMLAAKDLDLPVRIGQISKHAPLTMEQMLSWAELWPLVLKADSARSVQSAFPPLDKLQPHYETLHNLVAKATIDGEFHVATVIIDPNTWIEVGSAHDTRRSTSHPLHHSIMNAITSVATHHASLPPAPNPEDAPYLCKDYIVLTTHEPCVMCCMALVHSRIRLLVYGRAVAGTGAVESTYGLHWRKELNHRFGCFGGWGEGGWDELDKDVHA
ncbi:hypothetical protein YB2330_006253 [Saitoella coloradoensis]